MPRRFTDYEIDLRLRSGRTVVTRMSREGFNRWAEEVDLLLEAIRDLREEIKELKSQIDPDDPKIGG